MVGTATTTSCRYGHHHCRRPRAARDCVPKKQRPTQPSFGGAVIRPQHRCAASRFLDAPLSHSRVLQPHYAKPTVTLSDCLLISVTVGVATVVSRCYWNWAVIQPASPPQQSRSNSSRACTNSRSDMATCSRLWRRQGCELPQPPSNARQSAATRLPMACEHRRTSSMRWERRESAQRGCSGGGRSTV